METIVGPVPRLTQQRRSPLHHEDYVCYEVRVQDPSSQDTSLHQGSKGTPYPVVSYISWNRFSNSHKAFLAAITKNY